MAHVDGQLARRPYLLGDAFSTADILFGSTFAQFKGSPLMPDSAVRNAYIERLTSQRAAEKDAALAAPAS
jgi:glutathione S-transferase